MNAHRSFVAAFALAASLSGIRNAHRRPRRSRRPGAAAAALVVSRAVRHLRSGAAAARLQDLSRGLLDLPQPQALAFRNLADPGGPGFTEAQAATIAAGFQVTDGPNDQGQMFQRPGRDRRLFPAAVPNDRPPAPRSAARCRRTCRCSPRRAATSAASPGSSSMRSACIRRTAPTTSTPSSTATKAPAGFTLPPGGQYNKYFPGHAIGMPKPLSDGQVEYTDGTPATVDQYGRDIAAFLMWAAEPTLDARKRLGFQVMIFLIVLTGLLYFTKKRVWHAVLHDPETRRSRARRPNINADGRQRQPGESKHDQRRAFENDLKAAIRTIPDYPKPGIMFRDITTLLGDARAFRRAVDELVQPWAGGKIDKVAGIEARGFILGGAVAHQVSAGFVPIRKKGKLPFKRVSIGYSLEYGIDEMEMHEDAVINRRAGHPGRRSRRHRRHRGGRGQAPQADRRRTCSPPASSSICPISAAPKRSGSSACRCARW
jgi:ubiquinol-cytochrome c reductase cytochrome c1 subunit